MAEHDASSAQRFRLGRILLALALATATLVASKDITNEASISLQGDMPRYLMDGVFLKDFVSSGPFWPLGKVVRFAEEYYARYPALSLGHHPPLLPVSLVPFFAVFGVSVESARIALLGFFVVSVLLLFTLVRRTYDEATAGWACLLFASSPFVGWFSQRVMSEVPAMAMVLATLNCIVRFRATGRVRDYFLFIVMAVLSLAMRQLAVFVFPLYAVMLVFDGGWARLRQPKIMFWTAAGAVTFGGVAIATLLLSPFNVAVVRAVFESGLGPAKALEVLETIVREQLWPVLFLLSSLGIMTSVFMRDRRIVFVVCWIAAVLFGVVFVTGEVEPARYSALALPAYCIAAATLWTNARRPALRVAYTIALLAGFGAQLLAYGEPRVDGANGYEQAATFVLESQPGSTVLFSASVDTGYFVFFVRKHDPDQRLVVLRSDKVLTTSQMGRLSVEDRISTPQEIYGILRQFGTRYVVIEDHPTGSRVLDWLRDELHTDKFAERRRFPSLSSDHRLRGVDIAVYEYLDATAPSPEAQIDLKLPLVGREIRVPLAELQARPGRP